MYSRVRVVGELFRDGAYSMAARPVEPPWTSRPAERGNLAQTTERSKPCGTQVANRFKNLGKGEPRETYAIWTEPSPVQVILPHSRPSEVGLFLPNRYRRG